MNRERAADFASLVDYRDRYEPGARRFDVGERSNFVLMPMAVAALQQLTAWSPAAVAASLGELTARIAAGARERGLRALDPPARGPHLLGLRFPDGLPAALTERLAAHNVHVSIRGDSVRVAPHLYNDPGDVERLLDALTA